MTNLQINLNHAMGMIIDPELGEIEVAFNQKLIQLEKQLQIAHTNQHFKILQQKEFLDY